MKIESSVRPYLTPQTITSLQEFSAKFPQVSIKTAPDTLRAISPLFLYESPYDPTDSFIDKCIKTVVASFKLFSYFFQETRQLIAFLPLVKEIKPALEAEIENLEKEVFSLHNEMLDTLFIMEYEEEVLKVLEGESPTLSKEALFEKFLASYSATMAARKYVYHQGEKRALDDQETQAKILASYREHLEGIFGRLEALPKESTETVQKRILFAHDHIERLIKRKTQLTETSQAIAEFLESPLH